MECRSNLPYTAGRHLLVAAAVQDRQVRAAAHQGAGEGDGDGGDAGPPTTSASPDTNPAEPVWPVNDAVGLHDTENDAPGEVFNCRGSR